MIKIEAAQRIQADALKELEDQVASQEKVVEDMKSALEKAKNGTIAQQNQARMNLDRAKNKLASLETKLKDERKK